MAVIEIKSEPSARDLRVLALAFLVFFGIVAGLAWWSPGPLAGAAIFTGVCFLIALAVDRETPARVKAWGALFPAILGLARGLEAVAGPGWVVIAVAGAGVVGAIGAMSSAGPALYRAWMRAALPVGWVVSHVLLGLAYYGVITPIGLFLRLIGRDLLSLKRDRDATTYWRERGPGEGAGRYFRQW